MALVKIWNGSAYEEIAGSDLATQAELDAHTSDSVEHGGGVVLASTRLTTSYSLAAGSAAAGAAVPGFSVTYEQPPGSHLVAVHAVFPAWGSVAADQDVFSLRRNSQTVSEANGGIRDLYVSNGSLTWKVCHLVDIDLDPPTPGTSVTYDLFVSRLSGTGGVGILTDTIGFGSYEALMWAEVL